MVASLKEASKIGSLERNIADKSVAYKIKQRDNLTESTGHYWGVKEFTLKEQDPMKFERFYSRLQSACMSAREISRYVAASPGGREMGEAVWGLATAEGDSVALSEGFVSHSAAFPYGIKFMVDNGYEENPGFHDADVYVADDGYTCGAPHPGDTYTYVPIVRDGEVISWACAVNHIMEVGAPQAGSWAMFAVDTFMDGFVCPPTRTGENLKQYAWWDEMWKRRTRAGTMNILDDKMRLAGCAMILQSVHEIIDEFGVDYYLQASKEVIEESRRVVKDNINNWMVPGTYEQSSFRTSMCKGLQKIWEHADKDSLIHIYMKSTVDAEGRIHADMEGSSKWDYHAFNAFPGGHKVAMMMGLAGALGHNSKFTSGGNYMVSSNLPEGSIYNPGTHVAAHGNGWAQMLMVTLQGFNMLTRAQFMRGYMEESFAVCGPWDAIQGEGVLDDGTPYGYAQFELLGASAQGAYAYRDGESAVWFVASQLCNMGNSEEFEQLIPPLFHLGRKLEPGYCGYGKFRSGMGLTTVQWINEPGQRFTASRAGSSCAMIPELAVGMMGAYPTPGATVAVAQGTNLQELFKEGISPSTLQEVVDLHEEGTLEAETLKIWKSDARDTNLKQDDLWCQQAGSGGGWGDPLERDPALVVADANSAMLNIAFAEEMHGVVLTEISDAEYEVNIAATVAKRKSLLAQRKAESVPISEWYVKHREERVLKMDMLEPIVEMLRSATSFDAYNEHYRGFWHLADDFKI
ncbi:hydantoinase [Cycloclasticus sp. 46_120_T64]|nr:hydantoinase [Cycloclasticus sp. 46_120_T64]